MSSWHAAVTANTTIAVAYYAIAWGILAPIARSWADTEKDHALRVAVATGLIFLSCASGHAVHAWHMFGVLHSPEVRDAARLSADWHMGLVDGWTAIVGVTYWSLRRGG